MAVTASRLVGAIVAMAVFGAAAGYGVGDYTQPDLPAPAGSASPLANASVPSASPTQRKKTPKPDNTKPLDPDALEYREQTFIAQAAVDSTITVEVPRGWEESRPEDDEARFTDSKERRWVRVQSGNEAGEPPREAMRRLTVRLQNVAYEQDLIMLPRSDGTLTHNDGTRLTISTIGYTYIPYETKRLVLVRSIGFGSPGYAAVEVGVVGLPQDRKALEAILDRATKTVRRKD